MPSILVQTSSLELTDKNEDTITIDEFSEGTHEKISSPSFKGDDEEWSVPISFNANGDSVSGILYYSSGLEGINVNSFSISEVPVHLTVASEPDFEFEEHDEGE